MVTATPGLREQARGDRAAAHREGADVSAADKYGWTPLHRASQNGHEAIAQLLIERGADENGSTPNLGVLN